MKISRSIVSRRYRQGGSAVLVLLILLVIMLMLITANSSTLLHLHRELKLLDQRQVERLNASQTNTTTTVISPAQPGSK
jgi:Zn-dependent protease